MAGGEGGGDLTASATDVKPGLTAFNGDGDYLPADSMTSGNMDSTLIKVCSFVPFTAPMAMFARIGMSSLPWWEIALSVAILALSTVGTGVLGAKIYRVGVLLYGTPPKLSAIFKALKQA